MRVAEKKCSFCSHAPEAKFFRRLYGALPELIDILCSNVAGQQSDLVQIKNAVSLMQAYPCKCCQKRHLDAVLLSIQALWTHIRRKSKLGAKRMLCDGLRKSDGPAILYFLCVEATRQDQEDFTRVAHLMVPNYKIEVPAEEHMAVARDRTEVCVMTSPHTRMHARAHTLSTH